MLCETFKKRIIRVNIGRFLVFPRFVENFFYESVHFNNETVHRDKLVIMIQRFAGNAGHWATTNCNQNDHIHVTNIRQQQLSYSVFLVICYDIDLIFIELLFNQMIIRNDNVARRKENNFENERFYLLKKSNAYIV